MRDDANFRARHRPHPLLLILGASKNSRLEAKPDPNYVARQFREFERFAQLFFDTNFHSSASFQLCSTIGCPRKIMPDTAGGDTVS